MTRTERNWCEDGSGADPSRRLSRGDDASHITIDHGGTAGNLTELLKGSPSSNKLLALSIKTLGRVRVTFDK